MPGSANLDCNGDESPGIALRADPVTGVYDAWLPGLHLDASQQTAFTTTAPKPDAVDHETTGIDLPAVAVRGLPFPQSLQTLYRERMVHHVGAIPATGRDVHLDGRINAASNLYAVAMAARDPAGREVTGRSRRATADGDPAGRIAV